MRFSCRLASAFVFALLVAPAPARAAMPIVERAIDGFVRPAYASFHASATRLEAAMSALCASPSPAALEAARQGFADTAAAWSRVELIRFGPISEENRLERILFWPDRKGTGLKQVQTALAQSDASATDPATLKGKSVAMQGFGALEFILFGTGAEALATTAEPYRCAFGATVAANIDAIAGDVDRAWATADGFAAAWANPGADNAFYRDDGEALGELFDIFVNGLELVRDVRINGFLGRKAEDDRPRQALYWRSAQTGAALAADMEGMKGLFEAADFHQPLGQASQWIADSIGFQLDNAIEAAKAAGGPIDQTLKDPERRGKLDYLRVVTSSLSQLFGTRLSGELGVTSGFSSLDGD